MVDGKRIASLDVLRLVACWMVLVVHARAAGIVVPWYSWVYAPLQYLLPGSLAITLFFVISGFVITRILLREQVDGVPLRYFLARRSMRIFPPYFALLLGTALVLRLSPAMAPGRTVHWSQWIYVFNLWNAYHPGRYLHAHTWTLSIEEQFYLVWPVLLCVAGGSRAWWILVLALLPASVVSAFMVADDTQASMRLTLPFVMALGAGALMAYAEPWCRSPRASWLGLTLIAAGCPFLHNQNLALMRVSLTSLSVGIVLVCLAFVEPHTHHRLRPLRMRWLTEAGIMSYGLYLYHWLALDIVKQITRGWWSFPLCALLTVALALLSYRLLERPLIQYASRRFRAAPQHTAALASPLTT